MNQLRYFVAVAEELNFRRAARRLNISQPPLSRHINLLEHALGIRLFDRTNRSVRLTAAGERFLFDAIDILKRAEAAALFARQTERGEGGALVLGFVPSATMEVIPRIVLAARERMPGLELTLREMMTYEQVEGLMAGSLELGISRLPGRAPNLVLRRVWSEPFVLAVPRQHPLAEKPELTVQDLNGVDFIGYSTERGGFLYEVLHGYLNSVGVTPKLVFSVSQSRTVMALVDAGLGLGFVPRSNARMQTDGVVFREIALPDSFRSDLYLALGPKDPSPLLLRFSQLVTETLAQE
ncbi:MAG: LysR substrate-binding domain-containing protein [Paracoccaceae bacterium]